jgi:predicted transcriptional regulator
MAKKLSDEIIQQIPVLYKQLGVKNKVAEQLGISVSTVTKYLTLYEAAPEPKEPKKKTKITDEIIAEINRLYSEYKNMSKVAKELDIAPTTVKKYLNEENLELKKNVNDDRDALWYYIYRLFGPSSEDKPVSDWNITQMQKFKSQGMPYKGQLLTLKYFYEEKKNSIEKSNGSIGIIPHVYTDARLYWESKAKKADDIGKAIQKQLEQDRIEIKYNPSDYIGKKKKKKMIDLDKIGE